MMTLNELIKILKTAPKPETHVHFDFARCIPTRVGSWRGSYDEPALGWDPAGYSGNVKTYPTVASLLDELEESKGRLYMGWKGGDYYYNGSETLHIDNNGDSTNTEITRVEIKEWEVVIHTATEPYA